MENRLFRRTIAAVMAVAVIGGAAVSSYGSSALSDNAVTAAAADSASTVSFDAETGTLTLSGNVVKEDVAAYKQNTKVKKVIAEEGTILPADCSKLFYSFRMAEIDLRNADTSAVTDMSYMFDGCTSLGNFDLSGFDTSNVTSMNHMFGDCYRLTTLDLTKFDTSKVTDMSWMFYNCMKLTSLKTDSFDTSKVTDMSRMFFGCQKLYSVPTGNFDTSNVTDMSFMFGNCLLMDSFKLGSFDTSKVTNMSGMFYSCEATWKIDVSGFKTSNVTNMSRMFECCRALRNIDVSGFDTSSVTDMSSMFNCCYALKTIDVSNFDTSKVQNMALLFSACKAVTELDLRNFDTSDVTDMYFMFSNCEKLEKIDLSSFDTSKVEDMEDMFNGCEALEYLDLTGFDTSSVTSTESVFLNCKGLKDKISTVKGMSLTLEGNIGVNISFIPCESLSKVVLSGPDGDITIDKADLAAYTDENGVCKLTYPVNATQAGEAVTMKTFDADGRQLILVNEDEKILSFVQAECSVQDYIDSYAQYQSSEKLDALVDSLSNYCDAANAYFTEGTAPITAAALTDEDMSFINSKKMKDETGRCSISLVLNSKTAVRIYSPDEAETAKCGQLIISPSTSQYGKFFEIPAISADKLSSENTLIINGKEVTFSALSYVQRVLGSSSADDDLKALCTRFYEYSKAADEYYSSN
ncbi:BspA family leucine-rich repeat surface protein [Ruminococcus sp.]|uniref:BspA family leucine-rich repeat surface protein n=1 Tax=Ruminococcus sp. TaxID=41978 RepID=UPI0025DC3593|nr:BspA family leucine-rich repeat surface protein [Ruminococcus sp.]MBQ6252383.1 BspA family leucine-rich repeat surface protein [Ruminococcus sp.]